MGANTNYIIGIPYILFSYNEQYFLYNGGSGYFLYFLLHNKKRLFSLVRLKIHILCLYLLARLISMTRCYYIGKERL